MTSPSPTVGVFCPDLFVQFDVERALLDHDVNVANAGIPQDLCSALFRDPDMIGLLVRPAPLQFATMTVEEFRRADVKNPIMVLLETPGDEDAKASARAAALRAGADDCKPLDTPIELLVAMLKALSKRGTYSDHQRVQLPAGVVFDGTMLVRPDGTTVHLTSKEAAALTALIRRRGGCASRGQLLDDLYGHDEDIGIKIVDVWVFKVRQRIIAATGGIDCIKNIWGRGYSFVKEGFVPGSDDYRRKAAVA